VPNSYDIESRNEDRIFLLQKIIKSTIWEFGYIPDYTPYQKHARLYGKDKTGSYLTEERP
jgi:hypothetical protein